MSNLPDASSPPAAVPSTGPAASHRDVNAEPLWLIIFGIMLAGGSYPLALGLIGLCYGIATTMFDVLFDHGLLPRVEELIGGLLFAGLFALIGGFIGLVWTLLVSLLTTPVFHFFLWSMRLRPNNVWLGATLGGLAGFLAVSPFLLVAVTDPLFDDPRGILFLLGLGPGLTTVLGQAGGAWGGRRAMRAAANMPSWLAPFRVGEPTSAASTLDGQLQQSDTARRPWFQFGMRELLWLTVWLSLLLAAVSATSTPLFFLALVGGWLVYQTATLHLGAKLLRWLDRWRAARRARREQAALATAGD